jgi:hypothetical protein
MITEVDAFGFQEQPEDCCKHNGKPAYKKLQRWKREARRELVHKRTSHSTDKYVVFKTIKDRERGNSHTQHSYEYFVEWDYFAFVTFYLPEHHAWETVANILLCFSQKPIYQCLAFRGLTKLSYPLKFLCHRSLEMFSMLTWNDLYSFT